MSKLCECLVGKVALRGVCEDRETCVNYLNDIPGISNEAFSYLRNLEAQTASEIFEGIESSSIDRLYYDLLSKSKFKRKRKDKKHITGKFKRPCELIPADSKLVGYVFNLSSSDYLEIRLDAFKIHTEAALSDFIYVFDLETGELLEKIAFTTTGAGEFRFDLDEKVYASCEQVYIAYDGVISSCETEPKYNSSCYKTCNSCTSLGNAFYSFTYTGDPEDALPIKEDLDFEVNGGLILEYKTLCSFSLFMCDYADELAPVLRLAMGIQFFAEIPGILGKLNKLSLLPKEHRTEITDELKDQYEVAISDFMDRINPDCCCFECDSMFSIKQKLP